MTFRKLMLVTISAAGLLLWVGAAAQTGAIAPGGAAQAVDKLLDEEKWAEALKAADAGLSKAPGDLDLTVNKIRALMGLGRHLEAARLAMPMAGKHPDRPEFRYYAGECAFQMGMIPQAVQTWAPLLSVPEWSAAACRRSVLALSAVGKDDQAKALLKETLAKTEKPTVGLLQLALNMADSGPEGVKLADRLMAADPGSKDDYAALKGLYAAAGNGPIAGEKGAPAYPVTIPLKEKSEWRDLSSLSWGGGDVGTAGVQTTSRVVIPIAINGSKEKSVLLDSGSDTFLISPTWVKELNLEPLATAEYLGMGYRGTQKSNWVLLKEVTVGSMVFQNVPAMVIGKDAEFFKEVGGIVPLGLFKHHALTYDRRHSKLVVTASGTSPSAALGDGAFTVKNLWLYDRPFVETAIQGKTGLFCMVDTGAFATFLASEKADELGISINSARFGSQTGSGLSGSFLSGIAPDVKMVLGKTLLNMQTVHMTPLGGGYGLSCYGILGRRDVLDLFSIFFDYKANVVAFNPYDK